MQSSSSDNCVHPYNTEIFLSFFDPELQLINFFDPELQLISTKPMIKNKLKELLSELKKSKVQAILALEIRKEIIVKSFIQVLN